MQPFAGIRKIYVSKITDAFKAVEQGAAVDAQRFCRIGVIAFVFKKTLQRDI